MAAYTDIRLVPMSAEHHAALHSDDAKVILAAVRYLIGAYDKSPPLTHSQALAYALDLEWWQNEIGDL